MLPKRTRDTLAALCTELSIPTIIEKHKATFSAAETQSLLPKGCLVQKTLTGQVAGRTILWSGIGDFRIPRALYRTAHKMLSLPARSDHVLNPPNINAAHFYGMEPGMVSPFLIAGTPAIENLVALFLLDWSHLDQAHTVAISLSLHDSLILPLKHLNQLLHTYAAETFGHIPLHTLQLPIIDTEQANSAVTGLSSR